MMCMSQKLKSSIGVLMGVVILLADAAWLIVGSSYTYLPWLILSAVIFLATIAWIVLDVSLMRDAGKREPSMEENQTAIMRK
jgi:hypothetical protein